jgi:hypothetical protein
MAPHRRPPELGRTNRVHLRLPTDVFDRIEAKAKRVGRPFHRILVEELSLFPHLDREARFCELIRDMETVLAQYGSRVTLTECNEALLHVVDETLAARTPGQLKQQLDRLRAIRRTMQQRRTTTHRDEQLVGRTGLLERQVREMEAFPEDIHEPGIWPDSKPG